MYLNTISPLAAGAPGASEGSVAGRAGRDVPAGSSSPSKAMGTGTLVVMIVFIAVIFTVAVVVWLVYCQGGRSRQQGKTLPPPLPQQQMVMGMSQMAHVGPGMGDQSTLPIVAPAMMDRSMGMGGMSMVGPPSM